MLSQETTIGDLAEFRSFEGQAYSYCLGTRNANLWSFTKVGSAHATNDKVESMTSVKARLLARATASVLNQH